MTPRERHDMPYIIGAACVVTALLLLYGAYVFLRPFICYVIPGCML